jgi:hypothetical protein
MSVLNINMSITQTLNLGWSNSAASLGSSVVLSAAGEDNRDVICTGNTTSNVTLDFLKANLVSFYALVTGGTGNVSLKTNSSGSPQDTFTLQQNCPMSWYNTSALANPFAGNVTSVFLQGTTGNSTVNIRTLSNTNP